MSAGICRLCRQHRPERQNGYCPECQATVDRRAAPGAAIMRTPPRTTSRQEYVCDECGCSFWAYSATRPKPLKFCNRACMTEFFRRTGGGRRIEEVKPGPPPPPDPSS